MDRLLFNCMAEFQFAIPNNPKQCKTSDYCMLLASPGWGSPSSNCKLDLRDLTCFWDGIMRYNSWSACSRVVSTRCCSSLHASISESQRGYY